MPAIKRQRADIEYIVIHCSATPPTLDVGVEWLTREHRKRGFFTIGYHSVIRRNGDIEDGRDLYAPGVMFLSGTDGDLDISAGEHVSGWNMKSVGICLIGGVDNKMLPENNFTEAQWDPLSGLLLSYHNLFPTAIVQGHRDFPGVRKACPSFDVAAWVRSRPELHILKTK